MRTKFQYHELVVHHSSTTSDVSAAINSNIESTQKNRTQVIRLCSQQVCFTNNCRINLQINATDTVIYYTFCIKIWKYMKQICKYLFNMQEFVFFITMQNIVFPLTNIRVNYIYKYRYYWSQSLNLGMQVTVVYFIKHPLHAWGLYFNFPENFVLFLFQN